MTSENNVITLQMQLTEIIDSVYNRIKGIVEKYGSELGNFPKLPEYDEIINSPSILYKYYNQYLEIGDEIICVMMAVSLVHTSLIDIRNTKLTKDLTNEYSMMTGFKKFLDEHIESLIRYKFDLVDLKRQAIDRVRLLQSLSYKQ
jgi:hypothetical protein